MKMPKETYLVLFFLVNWTSVNCIITGQDVISNNNILNSSEPQNANDSAVLPLGEALNLLSDYGFLAFNIHVAPLTTPVNYTNSSIFQMETNPVLDQKEFKAEIKRYPNKYFRYTQVDRFTRLHLCHSVEDLTATFFHAFHVDGLHKPWRAFAASWKRQFLPKIFGVPATFLTDSYNFVVVRIEKHSIIGSVNGSMVLDPDLLAKLPVAHLLPEKFSSNGTDTVPKNNGNSISSNRAKVVVDWRTAVDFFMQFGTHLMSNYSAGDALFQVLVYNASALHSDGAESLREKLAKFKTVNATRESWVDLLSHPSPIYFGKLQLLSGNRTQVTWLESRLALSTLPKSLPSSIRLLAAPVLFNHFYRQLQPRVILSMNLASITRALPVSHKGRRGLHQILLNLLRMLEHNM